MNDITRLLDEVLFENRDGKYIPKHPKLKRTVFQLVSSLSRYDSFEEGELIGSSFTIAWEALNTFQLAEGATWSAVIDGTDAHNLNRAVLAICKRLEHEMPLLANPNTKRLYDPATGGKTLVTINFDSTDRELYDEAGEAVGTVGDAATTSYFASQGPAEPTPFLAWFRANRHEFLTARQNEFIDDMTSMLFAKDSDYVEERDFAEIVGMQPRDLDRMKKRIKERTLAAWAKQPASKSGQQVVEGGENGTEPSEGSERRRKYREFTQTQPCRVYDAKGEFQRETTFEPKEYKVLTLNTYGLRHDLREI